MLENTGIQKMAEVGLLPLFFILVASLVNSLFISHLYLKFYGTKGTGSTLHRAFPLLGVAITAIFVSLQFSIPLSLGLLGALSIVRFRTPIKDPEEVGFILLVIASSLTCATFNLPFLLVIMSVAIMGLVVLRFDKKFFRKKTSQAMAIFKVPVNVYSKSRDDIFKTIEEGIDSPQIDSIIEETDTCTLTYVFLQKETNKTVELGSKMKDIHQEIKMNVFYSKPIS